MRNELKSTYRMSYTFKVIALSVCEIIHWICIPFSSSSMVWGMYYTINNRVTEVHIRVSHIEFSTQYHATFNCFRSVHCSKKSQTLFNRAISIRRINTRSCWSSLLFCYFFCALFIDISKTFIDEPFCKFP